MKKFIPRLRVDSVYDIDLDALRQSGVKGIITDLDNTLVGAKDPSATPKLVDWLKQVEERGFLVIIVSNNNKLRVGAFAEPIRIPFIPRAKKPSRRAFRKALEMMKLSPEQAVVIGDQLLTDVFGANRMGMNAILVTPISPKDESFFTGINRRIEGIIYSKLRKRGLVTWDK